MTFENLDTTNLNMQIHTSRMKKKLFTQHRPKTKANCKPFSCNEDVMACAGIYLASSLDGSLSGIVTCDDVQGKFKLCLKMSIHF
jgi:hypothetical protein